MGAETPAAKPLGKGSPWHRGVRDGAGGRRGRKVLGGRGLSDGPGRGGANWKTGGLDVSLMERRADGQGWERPRPLGLACAAGKGRERVRGGPERVSNPGRLE